MKTHKNLFKKVITFQNLITSYYKARRKHAKSKEVARIEYYLETIIFRIQEKLQTETYQTPAYKQFTLYDPKKRVIKAVPFQDRIIHHAIYAVINPLFDTQFIFDSYACRKNKGTHVGLECLRKSIQKRSPPLYALKCDVKKYFPSVNQSKLKQIIQQTIGDKKLLRLLFNIIDSEQTNKGFGIPIGNLTSQLFANVYLHQLDMYVKHVLKEKNYFRYVDDFIFLHDSKEVLKKYKKFSTEFLEKNLLLQMPYYKANIFLVKDGVDFVGYKIFPQKITIRKSNLKRYKKRLKYLSRLYSSNKLTKEMYEKKLKEQNQSWLGYIWYATKKEKTKQFSSLT